ncbi:YceI family protein [Neorhodopirellula pilleata]|nr:YceI family protein [Neorhodopirellula pilleata]
MRVTFATLTFALLVVSQLTLSDVPTLSAAELDAKASKINFVGRKPDGSHEGGFKEFSAEAKLSPNNLADGSLVIEIDATSLWSDNPKLTNHLKNPDFFDVRKYPKIKFESTSMTAGDAPNAGFVTGKLTMLGKTNEVKVPIVCNVEKGVCNLKAEFKIDRTKWGMTYGEGKVDAVVDINAMLVFQP